MATVLRLSGDERGPISWSSFWAIIWCQWFKTPNWVPMVKNTEFGDDIDWNERKKFYKNWKPKPLELD